jgi:hypothetical protein
MMLGKLIKIVVNYLFGQAKLDQYLTLTNHLQPILIMPVSKVTHVIAVPFRVDLPRNFPERNNRERKNLEFQKW